MTIKRINKAEKRKATDKYSLLFASFFFNVTARDIFEAAAVSPIDWK